MSEPTREELLQQELHRIVFRAVLAEALRHRVRLVRVVLALLLIVGLLEFTADQWLGPQGADRLFLAGALIPVRVLQGEWWRLFTGPLLHADWSHLLLNAVALFVVGRPVEAAYGPSRFWLIFAGAGLAGAIATVTSSLPMQGTGPAAAFTAQMAAAPMSVGASGAIYGLIAAMIALGIKLWPRLTPGLRKSLVLLPFMLLLAMLAVGSLGSHVDTMAHVGGALGGLMLGLALRPQLSGIDRARFRSSAWTRPLAWACAGLMVAAMAMSILRIGQPLDLPKVRTIPLQFDGMRIAVPADLPHGVVRQGRCQGRAVDPNWALRTGRLPCWSLPLDGYVVLGRRDHLLTLDTEDLQTERDANRTGRFVRRQPEVLVHPLGDRWLWLVQASDSLLPSHARALQPLLPPAGSATVAALPQPGDAPWPALFQVPTSGR
jgi:membrane associated rhomboid family serine protease